MHLQLSGVFFFKSNLLSLRTKIRLYNSIIVPVVTYGAETWAVTQTLEKKLESFENNCLKQICGPIYDGELGLWRRRYAREVRAQTNQPLITHTIRAARLRWAGHVARADDNRFIKQVWQWTPEGRRPRGRPYTRWSDVVNKDLRELGRNPDEWQELAEDRSLWRSLVVAAKGPLGPAVLD